MKRSSSSIFCWPVFKLKWFFVFLAFSAKLYAEADGPDYWQVRNVDKNDVLNMRSYADHRAPKIAEIAHDAQCIKNLGCVGGLSYNEFITLSEVEKQRVLKQRPRWCRVNYRGQVGWVAGRYLQEAPCTSVIDEKEVISGHGSEKRVDPYNHAYTVDSDIVVLKNGYLRKPIEGSAAFIITVVGSKPLYVDLNDDGFEDAVLVLRQETGGSGTFYYLAVALGDVSPDSHNVDESSGATAIETCFLGDRIKIEEVSFEKNTIAVDYLDRNHGQPMASRPDVRRIKKFEFDGNKLKPL